MNKRISRKIDGHVSALAQMRDDALMRMAFGFLRMLGSPLTRGGDGKVRIGPSYSVAKAVIVAGEINGRPLTWRQYHRYSIIVMAVEDELRNRGIKP